MTDPQLRLPARPDELDAEWLTTALATRHPGVRVAGVEVLGVDEVTNTHVRLRLHYDEPAGAPERMFGKMLPLDPNRRASIAASGMGLREATFYASMADSIALRVPIVHIAVHDETDGSFIVFLEDLSTTGCTPGDELGGVSPDAAARALEDLAGMHVRYEDPAVRAAEAAWVDPPNRPSDYGAVLLQYGIDHHRDKLTAAFVELAELYIADRFALHDLWWQGEPTIIHGDPHLGNVFDDHGRIGFLDWGIISVGTPIRDVSYFLTMAMAIDDRRTHEVDLLRHYLDVRKALGGSELDVDELWLRHRVHAAYTVPASCQCVTFPENAGPRRRAFAQAFLERSEAAVEDLEARDALRQLGI